MGIGQKWDDKGRRIYNIRHESPEGDPLGLEAGLAREGLRLDEIDEVILTHLHFDHAGGLTRWSDPAQPGVVEPVFPGRRHHVIREQWSWAQRPSERDRGSYKPEDFGFLESGVKNTELVLHDGWTEVFPGVTMIPRRGHTPGMACVKVDADDGTWLFVADLIPTVGHIKVPYVMGYDLDPITTCREKREILSEAAREGWRLAFVHDPEVAWCRVESDGRGQWRPVDQHRLVQEGR